MVKKGKGITNKKGPNKKFGKLVEDPKSSVFVKGNKTSDNVSKTMADLTKLRGKNNVGLNRKHEGMYPFEDPGKLEHYCNKYESSLFIFGSHSKKRPNSLIVGRTYDSQMLDMLELEVESIKTIQEVGNTKVKTKLSNKPCFIFQGALFDHHEDFIKTKNLFLDLFHGKAVNSVNIEGVTNVIVMTAINDKKFSFEQYEIDFKMNEETKKNEIFFQDMGPYIDFKVRRQKFASDDLFKVACKVPKALSARKHKNIERDEFGRHGRLHVEQQDLATLTLKRPKALKKKKDATANTVATPINESETRVDI